jgi:hypothetical protein
VGIRSVMGFNVPQFLGCADDLRVIEMTIVQRPFVLDFAGAHLDTRPEFAAEIWSDWEVEKREQFEGRWRGKTKHPAVKCLAERRGKGTHGTDGGLGQNRLCALVAVLFNDSKFEHQRADELDVVVLVAGGGDVGKVVLETGLQAEFAGEGRFHANFGVH